MSLSRRERRALRAIENAISAEDPALADLLGRPMPSNVVILRMTWVFLGTSVVLLVWGLFVNESGLITGALLTLAATPVVIFVVAKALAQESSRPGRRGEDGDPFPAP